MFRESHCKWLDWKSILKSQSTEKEPCSVFVTGASFSCHPLLMWLWKLPSSTVLFSFALNVKIQLFFPPAPHPRGALCMELMHKITSKGPLSKDNAGGVGGSMLWTLFPLFRMHEASAQIEMKDYWGSFANTWNSNLALVNCVMVKEERTIVNRLCQVIEPWPCLNDRPVPMFITSQ